MSSTFMQEYTVRHFGKRVINKLAKRGITIVDSQQVPGPDGSWANATTAWVIEDNDGTARCLNYLQVIERANA